MPYLQSQLLPNGAITLSPYLSGNPQLASISQISGTASNGNQKYNALQAVYSEAPGEWPAIPSGLYVLEVHDRLDRLLRSGRTVGADVSILAKPSGVRAIST
jgi:hypothetical protein